jgi:hypothetical protein
MRSTRSFVCVLVVLCVLVSACTKKHKVGEACQASPSDVACVDAANLGSCRAFTWHVDPCRGPAGCASGVCDHSIAAADDSCGTEGQSACSADGKQLLRCTNGTMVVDRTCHGDKGCSRASPNAPPTCDAGPATAGDACMPTGGSRCSPDGKSILQCSSQTHHMVLERSCLGPKGCFKNPHFHDMGHEFLACDIAMGDVGGPCMGYAGIGTHIVNGGATCSTDGKHLLTCKDGVLVNQTDCTCTVTWASDLASYSLGCDDNPKSRQHSARHASAAFLSLAEAP